MNLSTFALRQKTFVIFFTILGMIAGIYSYFDLGKLEDPSFTVKSAVIVTLYPGADAKEVEQLVTDKVETKLEEMESLWKLRSLSRPGSSMIFVDLKEKVNSDELPQQWDLLRRKVEDVKLELPMQAQISIVQDEFSEVYGMLFAVYGDNMNMAEMKDHARELQRRIKAVDGVKKVQLHGIHEQEVNIRISEERLSETGLTMLQLIDQLQSQNMPVTAGDFDLGIENLRVEQGGSFQTVDDIRNVSIQTGINGLNSAVIRLGDIADITMDYQDPATTLSRFNGQQAVTLAVSPVNGINVVSIGDTLKQVLADYQAELPAGAGIGVIAYQPEEVQKSVNNFISNLIESIVIVVVVLLIFMGWRSASIVGASLLLTILFTLVYMNLTNVDLQRVSLGSFILALGMLVDNAIVIVDLFQAKIKQGIERTQAVIDSIKEMAVPLLAATVIAAMGTAPVLLSQTDSAEFSLSIVQVLCSSLLLSWVIAMIVTPLMCWFFLGTAVDEDKAKAPSRYWLMYENAVDWVVENPKKTLLYVVPLLVGTLLAAPLLKVNFMPSSDRAIVFLDYWLPNGGRIEQTSADMRKVEAWLLQQPEVESISSSVGESAPRFSVTVEPEPLDSSYGQILINTRNYEDIEPLVSRGDAWLKAQFPYAEPRFRDLKLATKDKYSIEARFIGPDPEVLHRLADEAKAVMVSHPNLKYVRDDWRQESKVMTPMVDLHAARLAGVTRTDIANAINRVTEGSQVGTMRHGDDLIPIKLRSANATLEHFENIPVRSLLGTHSVPMGQVVESIEIKGEESMIWRRNRLPAITVQAGVSGDTASNVRQQIAAEIEAIALPAGYKMEWGGEYYDEQRSIDDLLEQNPKATLLMLIILVAMFNAFRQPLIIMITLPLASIGIVWSLLLLDKPFGFMAIVGMICLSGMIIKNGIVLMDQIELERRNGSGIAEAIKAATLNRTMAISMAALTTALGMIPLLTDRLFDQMAATIIGGLTAASVLSLFVMPALYRLFYHRDEQREAEQIELAAPSQPVLTAKEVK
ncbi:MULTISPECIES: efflux RND transporter permease subunit [Shewanella]|jgi:multidrug efflux pump subunit AcrB|uniref:Efflux RND transporter permease subunit n=1 Tax=Shewanella indica TaxID=768528 RepID=A0ABU4QE05_9GAMM|nr:MULTISPECIES: efflux RND transporter permease subunit [Shewanella]MDX6016760.1 efflux RND transporter permease subunit [Shewanella indica]NDO73475.1 efflux RND transporter permease subunit [Shewanella sp. SE1]OIN17954.1 transporter [Shewanella algae]